MLSSSGLSDNLGNFVISGEAQKKLVGLFSSRNFMGGGNHKTNLQASITSGGYTYRNLICANPTFLAKNGNIYTRQHHIMAKELDQSNFSDFVEIYSHFRYPKSDSLC